MTAALHPRLDEHGHQVQIANPSSASDPRTWHAPKAVAVFIPGGECPLDLGGICCRAARLPEDAASLAMLRGEDLDDPALPPLPVGKRRSAGAVIVEADLRVWVFVPTNHFGGTQATFPKGRVEDGQGSRMTALREVWEETGLVVRLGSWLIDAERSTSVTRYFLAKRVAGSPAEMGWECQSMSLVPVERLIEVMPDAIEVPVISALQAHLAAARFAAFPPPRSRT